MPSPPIVQRHAQVRLIACGHLHRSIHTTVGGRAALDLPEPGAPGRTRP